MPYVAIIVSLRQRSDLPRHSQAPSTATDTLIQMLASGPQAPPASGKPRFHPKCRPIGDKKFTRELTGRQTQSASHSSRTKTAAAD